MKTWMALILIRSTMSYLDSNWILKCRNRGTDAPKSKNKNLSSSLSRSKTRAKWPTIWVLMLIIMQCLYIRCSDSVQWPVLPPSERNEVTKKVAAMALTHLITQASTLAHTRLIKWSPTITRFKHWIEHVSSQESLITEALRTFQSVRRIGIVMEASRMRGRRARLRTVNFPQGTSR